MVTSRPDHSPDMGGHRDPVAELLGLIHEVRYQNNGGATLPDLPDQLPRRMAGPGVQTLGQLVQEDHFG